MDSSQAGVHGTRHQRDHGHHNDSDLQYEFESVTVSVPIIHNEQVTLFQKLLTSTYSLSERPGAGVSCQPDIIAGVRGGTHNGQLLTRRAAFRGEWGLAPQTTVGSNRP